MAQKIEKSISKNIKNSWDSNSSDDDKKPNDWDSDSDCKETLVVPFNEELLSDGPWDSQSKESSEKKYLVMKANEKLVESEEDSLSIKSEIVEIESLKSEKDEKLYVEDIEEIVLDKKNSQDTAVPRTCSDSSEELKLLDEHNTSFNMNKSKSYPDFENLSDKKKPKESHSKSLEYFEEDVVKNTMNIYEGSNCENPKEKDGSLIKDLTAPQRNFYREYECRMVFPEEEEEKCVEVLPLLTDEPSTSYDSNPPSHRSSESSKSRSFSVAIRKSSKKHPVRKSIQKYQEKPGGKIEKKSRCHKYSKVKQDFKVKEGPVTESWIFLDESGQSQQVTKNEVSILLNGKSADAVLQEQKEHLLSQESIIRNASTELLSPPILEKNIQELISREDVTEEIPRKSIGLERKVGNMLLYIRSRVDLEASVKFISVDTDMINMWRRSKDYIESNSLVINEPEKPNNDNQMIDLQSIILQHSKTIESLAEDLKKFQNSFEEERRRNLELEKEMAHLRETNAKLTAEYSARKSNIVECEPFEYSSTAGACSSPNKEAESKREVLFEIEEAMPKFIGINLDVLSEEPYNEVKSCLTVNLFSTKTESENSSNNDELQTFETEPISKRSETNPFLLETDVVIAEHSENRPESRSNSSSHRDEDSETESLQTNLELKGKDDSSNLVKDLACDVKEAIVKLTDNGYEFSNEAFEEEDMNFIRFYIQELTDKLIAIQLENIDPDEYYRAISEKTALSQEVNNVKAENNLLLESQVEQYEKLKRVMQTLNEQKLQNSHLENENMSLRTDKEQLLNEIKLYEEEKLAVEAEMKAMEEQFILERSKLGKLQEAVLKKDEEIKKANEKLKFICGKFENFEEKQRSKEETISKLKSDNKELTSKDSLNLCAIEFLTERVKTMETEKINLESELTSVKISSEESLNYIANLERIVHDTQENLEKIKKKLSDSNESLSNLKKENERLSEELNSARGHCKKWKEKTEGYKEKINELVNCNEEKEKERGKITSENESLKTFVENMKKENEILKSKMTCSKDKFMKERKDLLNEIELANKKICKMDQKYRSLKVECNDRTNLISDLEVLLKKSVAEYNEKIVNLERNMSDILEKIEIYKKSVKEKSVGDESKFAELENQLLASDQEKWSLERDVGNYYKVVKKLQMELVEKQRSLEDMNMKLWETEKKEIIVTRMNFGVQTEGETKEEIVPRDKVMEELEESHRTEKKKLEETINELKSENEKYEAKIQVMMTNLSNCGKNLSDFALKQRSFKEKAKLNSELKLEIKTLTSKLEIKDKEFKKLKDKIRTSDSEVRELNENLKVAQSTITDLQKSLAKGKSNAEFCQRERNEMADKLLQSVKLVMDERASKQSLQLLFTEKEKNFKEEVEKKEKLLTSLQDEINRLRVECLKKVVVSPRQQNQKIKNVMEQLKNLRAVNLKLRKKEGELQGKIVLLEDELRNARLSMKQMEGELTNEKKSKKTYKTVINSVEEEIRRLQQEKMICLLAAEKIKRHFNLLDLTL